MRAVVLSHRSIAHELGLLEPWLDEVTHGRVVRRYREDGASGPDVDEHADLLVVLGSPASVAHGHCTAPAQREIETVRAWVEADRPYLGICFGSQVLARALGGSVRRMEATHRSYAVLPTTPGAPAALAGPWTTWHEDAISAPAETEVLAALPHGDIAFRTGRAWGIQSHVELTSDLLEQMAADLGTDPEASGELVEAMRLEEKSAQPPSDRVDALLRAFAEDAFA